MVSKRPVNSVRHAPAGNRVEHEHNVAEVLLITRDEEYRSLWQRIFASRGWQLSCTGSLTRAMNTLLTHPFPVIVYDCGSEDDDWPGVLNALCETPNSPCVLLTSKVIDENFRDEVVRLHGYDVLSRHADEDEIGRTINSAWFWKHRHA